MDSQKTIAEAREHAKIKNVATHIIEIEPGMPGIEKYICAKCNAAAVRKALSHKPMAEIKRVVGDAVDLAAERFAARQTKIETNIPGLDELRSIIADWDEYQGGFNRMMEDEMNDGVNPPQRPTVEVAEIARQYPIAAAYIKAENWDNASHYRKSGAGSRAKTKIENGEDYQTVIAEMEKEWSDHCDAHKWD